MGKGGGSTPKNQTSTVTNTPYLASYINDAAGYAKNLYQGNPTVTRGTTTPATGTATGGSLYVGPDGKVYDLTGKDSGPQAPGNIMALYGMGNNSSLQANGWSPVGGGGYGGTSTTGASTTTTGGQQTTPDGWPQFFPGQTYVDYSPETLQALQMTADRATAGSDLTRGANQTVLDTVKGNYLSSNPYIDEVINKSLGDVNKKYAEQVLPGIASGFAQSGRYGSGIQQNVTTNAVGQLGKEAMGVASGIRYDNYNNERQRQLQAAALAPSLAQSDYLDAQQLMGVGSARESLSQAKLQDAMDRFNFTQNQPANMLDQYINRINLLNGGYGTSTSTGPGQIANSPNRGLSALSGASTGLGIGSMMAPAGSTGLAALGGPWGLGLAAGGALLGGLFS